MRLQVGTVFDTAHESGCVVTRPDDGSGVFLALDSDGVECQYHAAMVARITSYPTAGSHRDPFHRGVQPS